MYCWDRVINSFETEKNVSCRKKKIRGNNGRTVTAIMEGLTKDIEGNETTVGDIVEQFRYRSFGPLLLVPALIVILPTGAIPLIPAICGLLMAFVCAQVVIGREHPWIPRRLKEFSIPKDKLESGIEQLKPYTRKLDCIVHTRWRVLVNPLSKRMIAFFCFFLCLVMVVIGFIPMLPATIALPVFFFGLAFMAKDGILVMIGILTTIGSGTGLYLLANAGYF